MNYSFKKSLKLFFIVLIFFEFVFLVVFFFFPSFFDFLFVDDFVCSDCNVVLILIDTLRADHLGVYGYERNTSPFIDSLARKGVIFNNVYSQESYTFASVPSIFTSLYTIDHGVLYNPEFEADILDESFKTIAEVLKENEYATAAIIFSPNVKSEFNFNQGFDLFDDNEGFVGETDFEKFETASKINLKALDWLSKRNKEKPFFLYLHYKDVHAPYFSPEPYNKLFVEGDCANFSRYVFDNRNCIISKYDGAIYYTDYQLKLLFNEINKLNEKTIYIITSDHGEEFYDHNDWKHGKTLYEEVINIPLIISFSYKHAYISVNKYVESIDIAPTILYLLNISIPEDFRGINLFNLINNKKEKDFVFSGGRWNRGTIIKDNLKYYRYRSEDENESDEDYSNNFFEELYNISNDPYERKNIILENPVIANKLRNNINRIFAESMQKEAEHTTISKKTLEQLKLLGYID